MSDKLIISPEQYVSPFEIAVKEHVPAAGDVYLDKNPSCNGAVIIKLAERDSRYSERWKVQFLAGSRGSDSISENDLKHYYRPLLGDYDKTMELAAAVAEGKLDAISALMPQNEAPAGSEELMATESPEHIRAVLDSSEKLKNQLEEIHLMADILIENKKSELDTRLRQMNGYLQEMKEKVRNIIKVITVLNLYTGQTVELHRLTEGEGASPDTPLSLRQRILFMDEELCVYLDHEADYQDVDLFFEWIKQPENRDVIVPEQRCVVTLKPKRFDMEYHSGDYLYDAQRNAWNKHTYIVIRNGENLWWAESDDLEVWDWAFPHLDFEEAFQKKYNENVFHDSVLKSHDNEKYRVTKYIMFVQGLIDQQTEVFGTFKDRPNLLKNQNVNLVRDDENLIGTGLAPWKDFLKEKNKTIRRGSRIVYRAGKVYYTSQYGKETYSGEFVKYYYSCHPEYPGTGLYNAQTIKTVARYEHGKPVMEEYPHLVFLYLPGDTVFDKTDWEYRSRKKRVSWKFEMDYVINYDTVSIEELEQYMRDRTQRTGFRDMLPLLKKVLLEKYKERHDEEGFRQLLKEDFRKTSGTIPDDSVIDEAITWWKSKVIFSRALRSNDAKAWKMIRQYVNSKLTNK